MKLVLYDGECGFCNASVAFIWKRDTSGVFSFTRIQSKTGLDHLKQYGIDNPSLDTFYLIDGDKIHEKSDAAIRIGRELRSWNYLAQIIKYIPRSGRNWLYDLIARNRHRLPQKQSCEIPPESVRKRFLDE